MRITFVFVCCLLTMCGGCWNAPWDRNSGVTDFDFDLDDDVEPKDYALAVGVQDHKTGPKYKPLTELRDGAEWNPTIAKFSIRALEISDGGGRFIVTRPDGTSKRLYISSDGEEEVVWEDEESQTVYVAYVVVRGNPDSMSPELRDFIVREFDAERQKSGGNQAR